jgi:hypothetical protein
LLLLDTCSEVIGIVFLNVLIFPKKSKNNGIKLLDVIMIKMTEKQTTEELMKDLEKKQTTGLILKL